MYFHPNSKETFATGPVLKVEAYEIYNIYYLHKTWLYYSIKVWRFATMLSKIFVIISCKLVLVIIWGAHTKMEMMVRVKIFMSWMIDRQP